MGFFDFFKSKTEQPIPKQEALKQPQVSVQAPIQQSTPPPAVKTVSTPSTTTALTYEAELEMESLHFLKIVDDPNRISETKSLANVLTGKIFVQANQILKIRSSGNYGIALHSILMNQLTMTNTSMVAASLMSYWALSNHIEHDAQHLLIQNRGMLMLSVRDLFCQVHRKALAEEFNQFTMSYSNGIITTPNTVDNMIVYDLYCAKQSFPAMASTYSDISISLGISESNFYTADFYSNKHKMMKSTVESSFNED